MADARALSVGIRQTSSVPSMNSCFEIVFSNGRPGFSRSFRVGARLNRPFDAITIRSLRSRSTGFAALWKDPHAVDPDAPSALTHTTSPRRSNPSSSCRIVVTSPARDR